MTDADRAACVAWRAMRRRDGKGEPMYGEMRVERTGRCVGVAGSEFRVTYPDDHVGTLWSPPHHDYAEKAEHEAATRKAEELYRAGRHRDRGNVGTLATPD